MSHLAELKLSTNSPRERLSPVARKRLKLLEQLDLQAKAADHAMRGEAFAVDIRRWVKVEGSADKQLVTKAKPVRPWWWKGETGQIMLSPRQGSRIMDLGDGKQSIEVGVLSELPTALEVIRAVVAAGELDEQLKKSPYVRPVVKPKAKQADPRA